MSAVGDFVELLVGLEKRIRRRMVYTGMHPYRIVEQIGDRLNLQAVNEHAVLLPQLVSVPKGHGMQGASETCRPGSIVLIGFQDGDPSSPFIAHYLDAQPLVATIDAQTTIRLGANAVLGVNREGDTVPVLLPPATFVGTIGSTPASGMVIWSPGQTMGNTGPGSLKVKAE